MSKLPIDLYPDIDTNTIMVMTAYPGASASDIENNVTRPLENVLNSVSDLKHREMLKQSFQLTGNMGKTPFCLDEIHVEQSCDNEPDWFELHITVVIGNLRIPFSRFRKHILEIGRAHV